MRDVALASSGNKISLLISSNENVFVVLVNNSNPASVSYDPPEIILVS